MTEHSLIFRDIAMVFAAAFFLRRDCVAAAAANSLGLCIRRTAAQPAYARPTCHRCAHI
jgi:hypothetical protein